MTSYITGLSGSGASGYWTDQNGQPRPAFGDTAWPVIYMAGVNGGASTWQSDIDSYVSIRSAQGYTAVECNACGNSVEGNATTVGKTWDSVNAFAGANNPSSGLNASYWQRLDRLLSDCATSGMTVFLNLAMADDLASTGIMNAWTNTQFQDYGQNLAARYAPGGANPASNLIWMIGDDYFGFNDTQLSAILTGIRAAGDNRPIAIENITEASSRRTFDTWTAQAWGDANATYNWSYSYNVAYLGVEDCYLETSHGESVLLPVMRGDGYYYDGTTAGDQLARQHTWWALSSGSRGFFGGIFSGQAGWGSAWASDMTTGSYQGSAGSGWISKIITFFSGLNGHHRLIPDTGNVFLTAGRGTRATAYTSGQGSTPSYSGTSDTYVSGSITPQGDLALIYWGRGASSTITVNPALMNPNAAAAYVDPASCALTPTTAGTTYARPSGVNSAGDHDWALLLTAPAATLLPPPPVISRGYAARTAETYRALR